MNPAILVPSAPHAECGSAVRALFGLYSGFWMGLPVVFGGTKTTAAGTIGMVPAAEGSETLLFGSQRSSGANHAGHFGLKGGFALFGEDAVEAHGGEIGEDVVA